MKPRKKNRFKRRFSGSILKNRIGDCKSWWMAKKAAFEILMDPKEYVVGRIRKTVVLALKAAYLHSQHPDWNIAVTFYTRSLSQQYKDMITNFSYEFMGIYLTGINYRFCMHGALHRNLNIFWNCKRKNIIPKTFSTANCNMALNMPLRTLQWIIALFG